MKKLFQIAVMAAGLLALGASFSHADEAAGNASAAITPQPSGPATPVVKAKKSKKTKKTAKTEAKKAVWVCPMGDYTSDKPGKCPNCGMDLVEKK
jgi:rubrerythrin